MMIRTHRSCENDPQSRAMTLGPASEGSQTRGPPPCRGPRRGRTAAAAPPAPAPAPGALVSHHLPPHPRILSGDLLCFPPALRHT